MIILFFSATYCVSLRDRLRCERRGRSSSIVTLTPSVRQRYGLASIVGSSHKKIIRHLIAKSKEILETTTGVIQEN